VRVFAALPLPPAVAGPLDSALAPARLANPGLRWVSADGFHVTLHFFGDVPEAGVAALQRVFDDAELRVPAIPTRLGRIGQFPPRGNPRVLWVGLARGEAETRAYWELFERKVYPLGWTPDARGFSAHITVARAGRSTAAAWDADLEMPGMDFLMQECVLFQSILGHAGAHYVPLKKITLERGQ
jgi:RNA 2',3'-cyclic 3'-phosphodiesterase